MVQGYYTLQEAAKVLALTPDELKQMAQRNQIRSFQDRGTWRFRVQDIQELARQRGAASDPELILGEGAGARSADSPVPRPPKSTPPKSPQPKGSKSTPPKSAPPKSAPPKSPPPKTPRAATKAVTPEVFDFDLGAEHVGVGQESLGDKRRPDSKPTPKPGSDSDVRLVADGSDLEFVFDAPSQGGFDSNVKLVGEDKPPSPRPKTPRKPGVAPESPVPKKQPPASPGEQVDSGVRLIPLDSDSDVKIVGASSDELPLGEMPTKSSSDSDIRLEHAEFSGSKSDEGLLTEEINLDEELKKQEARQKPQAKVKPKAKGPRLPSVSPFELSESQLKLPASEPGTSTPRADSSEFELTPAGQKEDSSDYDLEPAKAESSDFDLNPADSSSEDFSLELPESGELKLEPSSPELKGPSSGISLGNPVDAGISLEQGGEGSDEIEFELSLDAEATPKPAGSKSSGDSSEFELSLDADDNKLAADAASSDSEFELTLDDSGGLAPLEDDSPQVKAGEDKDIFETDFEVPALEDESGSQVAPLDTDLDSSDFDLALGDSEVASEEESGSQVVALDEEEADEAAATVAAKRKVGAGVSAEEAGFDQLAEEPAAEIEEAEGEEGPVREVVREKVLKPAPWGALPVVVMIPCVLVMFVVGLMGFELVQNMSSYKPAGFMTKTIGDLIGQKPK